MDGTISRGPLVEVVWAHGSCFALVWWFGVAWLMGGVGLTLMAEDRGVSGRSRRNVDCGGLRGFVTIAEECGLRRIAGFCDDRGGMGIAEDCGGDNCAGARCCWFEGAAENQLIMMMMSSLVDGMRTLLVPGAKHAWGG